MKKKKNKVDTLRGSYWRKKA